MARLRFGGPNLPDNAESFYRHVNPDGTVAGVVWVRAGAEVDEARVMDAQGYVDRHQATRVPDNKAADAAAKG